MLCGNVRVRAAPRESVLRTLGGYLTECGVYLGAPLAREGSLLGYSGMMIPFWWPSCDDRGHRS